MMREAKRQDTKAALLSAAERLVAEKGLGGVSVREITVAAGARNQSALHYHFGGTEDLMREIFAQRLHKIEKARLKRLVALDAAGKGHDIRALMEASMRPLFEACQEENGRLYASFSMQLMADPRYNVGALVRDVGMRSAADIGARLTKALGNLPERTLRARLRQVFTISIILMADYARAVQAGDALEVEAATSEAAATLAGFLTASPPGATG